MDITDGFLSVLMEEENMLTPVSKCRLNTSSQLVVELLKYANLDFVNLDNIPSTSPELGNPVFLCTREYLNVSCVYVSMYMYVCVCVCVHAHTRAYMYACVTIHVCMCV